MNTGKAVIIGLLLIAAAAASFAWWHQRHRGYRALQLWGSEGAWLIRHSERAELLRLEPHGSSARGSTPGQGHTLVVDGAHYVTGAAQDISQAPGIQHARQALIEDASFAWQASPDRLPAEWNAALRFADPLGEITLLLDLQNELIRRDMNGSRVVKLKIGAGLRQFVEESWETHRPTSKAAQDSGPNRSRYEAKGVGPLISHAPATVN